MPSNFHICSPDLYDALTVEFQECYRCATDCSLRDH